MAIRSSSVVRVTLPGFTGPFATFFKIVWNGGVARASW